MRKLIALLTVTVTMTVLFSCKTTHNQAALQEAGAGSNAALAFNLTLPIKTCDTAIVDANNKEIRLIGVNLDGSSDRGMVPYGLDTLSMREYAKRLKQLNFSVVRYPYADTIFDVEVSVPDALISANLVGPDSLKGMNPHQVYLKVIEILTSEGLLVILNNHSTTNLWCCGEQDRNGVWNSLQSPDTYYQHITQLASEVKTNPRVIGFDLRNEIRDDRVGFIAPHWVSYPPSATVLPHAQSDWFEVAEEAGRRLLSIRQDFLIIVEGLSFSVDFKGIQTQRSPVRLPKSNRLLYSPHSYSFHGAGNENRYDSNWGFLLQPDQIWTNAVWIGEFGEGVASPWWHKTVAYYQAHHISGAYWASSPERYDGAAPPLLRRIVPTTHPVTSVPDCAAMADAASIEAAAYAVCLMQEIAAKPRATRYNIDLYGILHWGGDSAHRDWFADSNDFRMAGLNGMMKVNNPIDPKLCADNFAYRWLRFHKDSSCLDVAFGGAFDAPVDTYTCHSGRNQQWKSTRPPNQGPTQLMVRYKGGDTTLCLEGNDSGAVLSVCDPNNQYQRWIIRSSRAGSTLQSSTNGQCLGPVGKLFDCDDPDAAFELLKEL